MEENKTVEVVENATLVVTGVESIMDMTGEKVAKVRLNTEHFDLTWKPKLWKSVFNQGMKVLSKDKPTIDQLPQELKDIAGVVNIAGRLMIQNVKYRKMTTSVDGQLQMYRFLLGDNPFADIVFNKNENQTVQQQENIQ